ncbi:YisL family protein [Pseudoneobacillus sp. C159]
MTHAHMTGWFLAIILLFVAIFLQNSGKEKGAKIVTMIIRVMYIVILATGLHLLFGQGMLKTDLAFQYILKALSGILVISSIEMILAKAKKKQPTTPFWILFVVAFALALFLGFKLPM